MMGMSITSSRMRHEMKRMLAIMVEVLWMEGPRLAKCCDLEIIGRHRLCLSQSG